MSDAIKKGMKVEFTGFTGDADDMPDNGELLVEGESYEVAVVHKVSDQEEQSYNILVPNPDFDSSKRKNKKTNAEFLEVDVFGDEVAAAAEQAEEEEEAEEAPAAKTKAKPKAKAKAKTPAKAAPKAKAKAKTKAKPKAKAKAAPKSKLKEATQDEDEQPILTGEKNMIILQEHEDDAEIVAMCDEAEDLCALAKEQCEENAHMDYKLGGILYHVRVSGEYKELDPEYAENKGFAAYCQQELGLKYRKAMYLIDIYTKFNRFNIDSDKVSQIGWTKASVVAGAMTEDNAEELIDLAEDSTVSELKESIRDSVTSKGSVEKITKKRFTFSLAEDEGAAIADYFAQAKEALQLESESAVFEHIVNEWALEHLNVKKARKTTARKKAA